MGKTKAIMKKLIRLSIRRVRIFGHMLKKLDDGFMRICQRVLYYFYWLLHKIKPLRPVINLFYTFTHKHQRITAGFMAVFLFVSVLAPVLWQMRINQRYELTPQAHALLGNANPNLTKKLTYDPQQQIFQFNKEGKKAPATEGNPLETLRKQIGGGGKDDDQLYSVDASQDLYKGVTYYENQMQLSFKLIPQFAAMNGKNINGHLIYPLLGGINGQLAYTTDTGGLKDNIILYKSPGNTLNLKYKLELPDTLEAKLIPETGEIGVYSADPVLFGQISYGSDNDQAMVEKVRKNSEKTYLTFKIPAPQVNVLNKAGEPAPAAVQSRFTLSGKNLTVTTIGLDKATYPLTIDPSVTITSNSDFNTGNIEDNNLSVSSNNMNRGGLTGGSVGSWNTTTNLPTTLENSSSAVYNGYIYVIGGYSSGGSVSQTFNYTGGQQTYQVPSGVTSVHIDAYGAMGGAGLGVGLTGGFGGRVQADLSVTPGETLYVYVGNDTGYNGGGPGDNLYAGDGGGASDVRQGGTALSNRKVVAAGGGGAGYDHSAAVGYDGGDGGGTTGWTGGSGFNCTGGSGGSQVGGGAGGGDGGSGTLGQGGYGGNFDPGFGGGGGGGYYGGGGGGTDTNEACGGGGGSSYAGTGTSNVTHTSGVNDANGAITISYTASTGDTAGVYYAPINSDGTIGTWGLTTSFTTARKSHTSVVYNGFLYVLGGYGGGYLSDVQYAPINSDGTIGSWASTTSFTTARASFAAVAYKGYVYIMGGEKNGAASECNNGGSAIYCGDVQYAPINANGSVGSWNTTTSFSTRRGYHASAVYNNYLYIVGGTSGSGGLSDVQYAPINMDGTVGTWTTTTALSTGIYRHNMHIYNGYIYVTGGGNGSTTTTVQYAVIYANGTVGSWGTTQSFTTAREHHMTFAHNSYLYIMGGRSGGTTYSDVQYAAINVPGVITSFTTNSQTGTPFTARLNHATAVYNGYIYVLGGNTNTVASPTLVATTYYAPINSNGSIGSWSSGTALPEEREGFSAVAYNGYLYYFGGRRATGGNGSTQISSLVYSNPIGSNGSLGSWTAQTSIASTSGTTSENSSGRRGYFGFAFYNGWAYIIGGKSATTTYQSTVYYAALGSSGSVGSWTTTTALSSTASNIGAVAYAGYIYLIGAEDSSGNTVSNNYYAQINSTTGAVGTWSTPTYSLGAQKDVGVTAYNGHLYVVGGETSGASINDIKFAKINSDGTVGNGSASGWTTTEDIVPSRARHGTVIYNGFLYVVGGDSGVAKSDVQYARINNGGSGTTGTWASAGSNFATPKIASGSVAYNGYLYILGGDDGTSVSNHYNTVQYAPINVDGTIGSWSTTTAFTTPLSHHKALAYSGYMYVLGGETGDDGGGNTYTNSVFKAQINSDGTLGSWGSTSSFTTPRIDMGAVAYNGYMHIVGGVHQTSDTACNASASTYCSDVQYAQINDDGTLGSWASTNSITTARKGLTTVANNGYLYAIGGYNGSTYFSDVQYATINSNGTVGTWNATTSFQLARYGHTSVVSNGYMYVIGGFSGSTYQGSAQYAPINANGTIGNWSGSTSFSAARYYHTTSIYNGYVYVAGGYQSTAAACAPSGQYCSDVQYASLNSISRKAQYSKTIDLGVNAYVTDVSFTPTSFPGGLDNIKLKTAPSNGVFGATLYDADTNIPPCNITGQYLQIFITIDDTQSGVFPDSSSSALLNDLTSTYVDITPTGPPPEKRLRHGGYFLNESLQPFDTGTGTGACG